MKRDYATPFKKYRESLKAGALALKEYLKGRVIKGTESYYVPKPANLGSRSFSRKYRERRKRLNKIAYRSRRINQLRVKGN